MCKKPGFELMIQFPATQSGRLHVEKVESKNFGYRSHKKLEEQKPAKSPLSRAVDQHKATVKVSHYHLYQQRLDTSESEIKKTLTKNIPNMMILKDDESATDAGNVKTKMLDSLIFLPKNGNNKKNIKLKTRKKKTLNSRQRANR